jgi:hypothetical protein
VGSSASPSTQSALGASKTAATSAAMAIGATALQSFALPQDSQRLRSGTERALAQLESRYQAMVDGIQLKYFDPTKIEQYIRMAEKRAGMEMSDKERFRLIRLAKINNPQLLKLLALELRIGIPKRLEQAALASLGELMLHRDDEDALRGYLDDPSKDDNLKAYVRTVLMMNKTERWMAKVETAKATLKGWFNSQTSDQEQGKKKRQKKQQPASKGAVKQV